MIMDDTMREIESHEFAARLNVASDLSTFLRIAEKEDAVLTLFRELDSPAEQQRLFLRIIELSMSSTDIRYENQWDTALALYLWAMSLKNRALAILMAGVVSRAVQCWWAAKISYVLLTQSPLHNDAGLTDSEALTYLTVPYSITGIMNSGETILPVVYLSEADKWGLIWHYVGPHLGLQSVLVTDASSTEPRKRLVYAVTGANSGTT
jgi:hypothetical protein